MKIVRICNKGKNKVKIRPKIGVIYVCETNKMASYIKVRYEDFPLFCVCAEVYIPHWIFRDAANTKKCKRILNLVNRANNKLIKRGISKEYIICHKSIYDLLGKNFDLDMTKVDTDDKKGADKRQNLKQDKMKRNHKRIPEEFLFDVYVKMLNLCNQNNKSNNASDKTEYLCIKDNNLAFVKYDNLKKLVMYVKKIDVYTKEKEKAERITEKIFLNTGAVICVNKMTDYNAEYKNFRPKYLIDADMGKISIGDLTAEDAELSVCGFRYDNDMSNKMYNVETDNTDKINEIFYDKKILYKIFKENPNAFKDLNALVFYVSAIISGQRKIKI